MQWSIMIYHHLATILAIKFSYWILLSGSTSTSCIHLSNLAGSNFFPILVKLWRRSATKTKLVFSLSSTLNASCSCRSKGSGFMCLAMRSRNLEKSKGVVRFSSAIMALSWVWVGLPLLPWLKKRNEMKIEEEEEEEKQRKKTWLKEEEKGAFA